MLVVLQCTVNTCIIFYCLRIAVLYALVMTLVSFLCRERQNQEARELEKQHKEREKERERAERERQEREKLERERQERQEREKMERERQERIEQERQDQEKQRAAQAVHQHFEESLRLAQQRVGALVWRLAFRSKRNHSSVGVVK